MSDLPRSVFLDRNTPPSLFSLIVATGIGAVTISIFVAMIPAMAEDFGVSYSVMQLAITAYLALTGIFQIIAGPLSDYFGRRPVLLAMTILFAFSAIAAGFAKSIETFMFFRMLQAAIVSGAALSRASVRDIVPGAQAASLIGYMTMAMALAPMLSPALGGYIGDTFGWPSILFFTGALGIFCIALFYFDYGETNTQKSATFGAQMAAYPDLLKAQRFWGYAMTGAFGAGCYFAFIGGAPFVGAHFYDLTPSQIGLYMGMTPVGYFLGNWITGRFAQRLGLLTMLKMGSVMAATGMALALIAILGFGASHPLAFFGFHMFVGFGNGLLLPNSQAGILDVRPKLAGSAAGLGGAMITFVGAALSAFAVTVLTPDSGPVPLIIVILITGLLSAAFAFYTSFRERQVSQAALSPAQRP